MKNIINSHLNFSQIGDISKIYLYIHDDLLNSLPSLNSSEKLVEIKDSEIKLAPFWEDPISFTQDKDIDEILFLEGQLMKKYIDLRGSFGIFVREGLKKKLIDANAYFKEKGYLISIKAGYRPMEVQQELFLEIYKNFEKKFLGLAKNEIYEKSIEFVADPKKYIAPHCTGGAIDCILVDFGGKPLDMGCPINWIGEESNMTTDKINLKQRQNREFFALGMLKNSFANLASEWWHFSYGDPYHSYFYGKDSYIYSHINF